MDVKSEALQNVGIKPNLYINKYNKNKGACKVIRSQQLIRAKSVLLSIITLK